MGRVEAEQVGECRTSSLVAGTPGQLCSEVGSSQTRQKAQLPIECAHGGNKHKEEEQSEKREEEERRGEGQLCERGGQQRAKGGGRG